MVHANRFIVQYRLKHRVGHSSRTPFDTSTNTTEDLQSKTLPHTTGKEQRANRQTNQNGRTCSKGQNSQGAVNIVLFPVVGCRRQSVCACRRHRSASARESLVP